jgi:hypothetical protein
MFPIVWVTDEDGCIVPLAMKGRAAEIDPFHLVHW